MLPVSGMRAKKTGKPIFESRLNLEILMSLWNGSSLKLENPRRKENPQNSSPVSTDGRKRGHLTNAPSSPSTVSQVYWFFFNKERRSLGLILREPLLWQNNERARATSGAVLRVDRWRWLPMPSSWKLPNFGDSMMRVWCGTSGPFFCSQKTLSSLKKRTRPKIRPRHPTRRSLSRPRFSCLPIPAIRSGKRNPSGKSAELYYTLSVREISVFGNRSDFGSSLASRVSRSQIVFGFLDRPKSFSAAN